MERKFVSGECITCHSKTTRQVKSLEGKVFMCTGCIEEKIGKEWKND